MKKTLLLFAFAVVAFASCTKTTNNTTNKTIIDTMVTGPSLPAFTVGGIHDITFVNGSVMETMIGITVQYADSAQETVTLSLSALPQGITKDTTNWITSGIPTYTTELLLLDTTQAGAALGTFPMTLTATGSLTGAKTFPFNIKIVPQPPCSAFLLGKYLNCSSSCGLGGLYTDSVYADPNVVNKIWFTNLNGTGLKIYGMYSCNSEAITIPTQTVGGITYSGSGDGFLSPSKTIFLNLFNGSISCSINMN
jgi:hypothetical protein